MAGLSGADRAKYTHYYQEVAEESEDAGEGGLNMGDFQKLMLLCGHIWSRELVANFFTEIDLDGDWKISIEEFLAFMSDISPSGSAQSVGAEIRRRFNAEDLNKDGYISADELKAVLGSMNMVLDDDWVQDFIKEWDTTGDGRLNFEEFVKMYVKTQLIEVDSDDDEETKKELNEAADKVTDIFISSDGLRRMCSERGLVVEGVVKVDDIRSVLSEVRVKLSDEQIGMCIETLDPDNSGHVVLESLMDMYEELCSQQCDEVDITREEEDDVIPTQQVATQQEVEEQTTPEEEPVPVAQTVEHVNGNEEVPPSSEGGYEEEQTNGGYEEKENVYEEPVSPGGKVQEPVHSHKSSDIAKRSEMFAGQSPNKQLHSQLSDDGAKQECKEVGVRSMIARWENKKK